MKTSSSRRLGASARSTVWGLTWVIAPIALGVLLLTPLDAAAAPAYYQDVRAANALITEWQMKAAQEEVERLAELAPDDPQVLFLQGRYAFYMGDYTRALELIDRAIEAGADSEKGRWMEFRALVEATHEVSRSYAEVLTPKGHFRIRYPKGVDRVLVPYASHTLERAYEEIGADLKHLPDTPILVEIYPHASTLATVSSLTEDEIRTSGTIALCKYNRLMITSPRAMLRGYTWLDTISHEFVHYVINTKAGGSVPIWLHEGIAKFEERRWRGEGEQALSPSSEHLLKVALEQDHFITFEQMHPSMAKLPSQEDAALAFAEVYTVIEYLVQQRGVEGIEQVLALIAGGMSDVEAFEAVMGVPFDRFVEDWLAYLNKRPTREFPDSYEERLVFADTEREEDELESVEEVEARNYLKLGDMLLARNRPEAAAVEYRKAVPVLGTGHPVLMTRLAGAYLELGMFQEAVDALQGPLEFYPSYVTTYVYLGRASLELGDFETARWALEEATCINPFNPEIHALLARVYRQAGENELASREEEFANLVR